MKEFNVNGIEFTVNDFNIVQFGRHLPVGEYKVTKKLTEDDIDNIICAAFEGGISYWAGVCTDLPEWKDRPKGIALSEWASLLLLNGKEVTFYDVEEPTEFWTLTLEKLIKGIQLNAEKRPHDPDMENGDTITADCIIQYAIFGELVFG